MSATLMLKYIRSTKTHLTAIILMTLLAISASSVLQNVKLASANLATLIVPTQEYKRIQDAINAAQEGDTITVKAGTYYQSVIVNKSVTLVGEGQGVTFIVGSRVPTLITITANNVNITGFTIQGGFNGLNIRNSNMSTIINNTITSSWQHGIYLVSSQSNTITNNTITLNGYAGVYVQDSHENTVSNNVVTNNKYVGIDLDNSRNTVINSNVITFQNNVTLHAQGIWSYSSNNSEVYGNIILNNSWGFDAYASIDSTVYSNIIENNLVGVAVEESDGNTFYNNNFVNNTLQVDSYESSNKWDNGTQGNYWSDYNGADTNHDGIGDTPYLIFDSYWMRNETDRFPLVSPWSPLGKDVTAPTTTDDYDGLWHNKDFRITLAADDFSGINATYYRINQASPVNSVRINGQPLITTESANNTLEYWSTDNAGNPETHKLLKGIKLDETPPTGSVTIYYDFTYHGSAVTTSPSVTLNLSANDNLSGVSRMRFSNDGQSWTPWETYATTKAWNLSGTDGLKTVYTQFMDRAGQASQTCDASIILDTGPPILVILSPVEDYEIESSWVIVRWSGTDAGVGIEHYEIRLDSGSWTNVETSQIYNLTGLSDGSHAVYVKAFDNVGQSRQTSANFVVNTSVGGMLTYLEEAFAVAIIMAALGASTFYAFKIRRRTKVKSSSLVRASA